MMRGLVPLSGRPIAAGCLVLFCPLLLGPHQVLWEEDVDFRAAFTDTGLMFASPISLRLGRKWDRLKFVLDGKYSAVTSFFLQIFLVNE